MTTTVSFEDLPGLEGAQLGTSGWLDVTQSMIDQFADATGDHQWIHVDPERAKAGPFGGPIAHGYLTLSLVIPLWSELLDVSGVTTKVNYGLNKVRFPSPVPAGASIRAVGSLAKIEQVAGGGLQITGDITIQIRGSDKPACVAQPVFRFYP
jgi:acyl dehydratase